MKNEAIQVSYSVEVDDLTVEAIWINDAHEYRIRKGQTVLFQSDLGYGQTGIALRDGLIKATDPLWIFSPRGMGQRPMSTCRARLARL